MDEDSSVSLSDVFSYSVDKHRSPTFSREEIEALVKLVDKYKAVILNKSTVSAVNYAKEAAWIKIAEVFNSQGFKYTRPPDCLKIKWENLKRRAKKVSNNLMDPKFDEYCDLTHPVVSLLCDAEMDSSTTEVPQEIMEELSQVMKEKKLDHLEKMTNNKQESDNSDGDIEFRKMRSLNFSPQESSILLKCVKEEQDFVFCKENTKNSIQLKRRAWARITEAFNKRSPQKRSTVTLQTKFCNMKRDVKKGYFKKFLSNKKHEKLVDEKIKEEPDFEKKRVSDGEDEESNGGNSDDIGGDPDRASPASDARERPLAPDPINTTFDGDDDHSRNRALNFSPHEVSVLLKCVKEEQRYIFSTNNTRRAIHLRNKAWSRITDAFNKHTEQERTIKVLRTKFGNLKKSMRPGFFRKHLKNKQYDKLVDESCKEIKAEPSFDYKSESGEDNYEQEEESACEAPRPAPDPLATVLSSDSGLGSTSFIGAYNFGNNEVTKLKLELLKYQIETAKLERQRLQESMRAESVERALRLRTARLQALAAARALPPAHPALALAPREALARDYLYADPSAADCGDSSPNQSRGFASGIDII